MTQIKFTGRDDLRILAADDLKKAGVDGFTKTSFRKGVVVEVEAPVAKALLEHPDLFGSFEAVESRDAVQTEGDKSEGDDKKKTGK